MDKNNNDKFFDDSNPQDRRILDALGQTGEAVDFIRPDVDQILAYITKTATPEQANTVMKAMAKSDRFRKEIIETIEEYETIEDRNKIKIKLYNIVPYWRGLWHDFWWNRLAPAVATALLVLAFVSHSDHNNLLSYLLKVQQADTEFRIAVIDDQIDDALIEPDLPKDTIDVYDDYWENIEYARAKKTSIPIESIPVTACIDYEKTIEIPTLDNADLAYDIARRQAFYDVFSEGTNDASLASATINSQRDLVNYINEHDQGYIANWNDYTISEPASVTISATFCPQSVPEKYADRVVNILNNVAFNAPRVMIHFAGSNLNEAHQYNLETAFINAFIQSGFNIFQPVPRDEDSIFLSSVFQISPDDTQPEMWQKSNMDIIIGIKAEASEPYQIESTVLKGKYSADLTIDYRILIAKTGQIIMADLLQKTGLGVSPSKAQTQSIEKAAESSIGKIIREMPRSIVNNPQTISMTCNRCDQQSLRELLSAINGMPDVYSARIITTDPDSPKGEIVIVADPIVGSTEMIWQYLNLLTENKYILKNYDNSKIEIEKNDLYKKI